MPRCWVGIGSNQGDARAVFDAAWQELDRSGCIRTDTRSGIYQTEPVGQDAGGIFSNAAISLSTTLAPLDLLDALQDIESDLGRTRTTRWGPRPIDLDLLFIDQLILNEPRLTIPHPAAWYRRFVLDPLVEIAPSLRHPVLKQTCAQLLQRLLQRPLLIACPNPDLPEFAALRARFPEVEFVSAASNLASVGIRFDPSEPVVTGNRSIAVADLTSNPGNLQQRVYDFLTAVFDQPRRISDW